MSIDLGKTQWTRQADQKSTLSDPKVVTKLSLRGGLLNKGFNDYLSFYHKADIKLQCTVNQTSIATR
jgi:hypothetical protein